MGQEKILGFDTVSSLCSVSIYDGTYHTFETPSSYGHARELMPLVARALESLGYGLKDMDALVVGLGPGSFTGIRIGLATALGLSMGSGVPCFGVDSLLSRSYGIEGEIRVPLMDARRGNVYGACFGAYQKEPFNGPFSQLLKELGERKAVFIGEKLEAFMEMAGENHRFVAAHFPAEGVIRAYLEGKALKELRPIYLRETEAQRRLEEKHAHSGN